jgi:hypothetical protein
LRHLRLGLEILLGRKASRPARVGEHVPLGDAHARLVGAEFAARRELHRVRRDDRQRQRAREPQRRGGQRFVVRMAGALHFEIKAGGKRAGQRGRRDAGGCRIALRQRLADFAAGESRQRDQAFRAFGEPLAPQFRTTAVLVGAMRAGQPVGQPQIARARLAEQQEAMRRVALFFVRNPDVATDDRLDAARTRRLVELDHPEDVGQIGERKRRHAIGRGGVDRVVDAHHAIDDRILAVQAQMDEQRNGRGRAHEVQFYSLPPPTPMIASLHIPARRALVAALVPLATALVLAACASVPPPSSSPGNQLPSPTGSGTEPAAPAKPQAPPTKNPNPPANVNLQGFPLPYRQGYADGCASIGSVEHKDPVRFKSDGQYRTGWQDGNFLCKKK